MEIEADDRHHADHATAVAALLGVSTALSSPSSKSSGFVRSANHYLGDNPSKQKSDGWEPSTTAIQNQQGTDTNPKNNSTISVSVRNTNNPSQENSYISSTDHTLNSSYSHSNGNNNNIVGNYTSKINNKHPADDSEATSSSYNNQIKPSSTAEGISPSPQDDTACLNLSQRNHIAQEVALKQPHPHLQVPSAATSSDISSLKKPPPLYSTSDTADMTSSNLSTTLCGSDAATQRNPLHDQQQQHHHHLINANSILSMTSIGFGIDSSPSAALGDATEAALKAVNDAMERSSLRLPITSPAQTLLQIKVKLGVPARQDGSGEPMSVNVTRLSSFLPRVIPVLPIQVTVGGLYLPSESQGSPSTCTAVACITLQSQTMALSTSSGSTERSTTTSTVKQHGDPALPSSKESTQPSRRPAVPGSSPTLSSRVSSTSTPSASLSGLQHLNHLAIAAASSPPHPMPASSRSQEVPQEKQGRPSFSSPQPEDRVHRSNSMEMLAMISEQIRNNSNATASSNDRHEDIHASASTAAAMIGAGLATAALQEKQQQQLQIRMMMSGGERGDNTMMGSPSTNPMMENVSASSSVGGDENGDDGMRDGGNYNNYNYKKLPPGVTTKKNQRLFVRHKYKDYSSEQPRPGERDGDISAAFLSGKNQRILNPAFPVKLHETLTQIEMDGYGDIIGWLPHGRSFKIHKQKEFAEIILPRYFIMTKKSSFLRQLNLYSFNRFSAGPDQGSYYHEMFLRGMKFLCRRMSRQKVNGNRIRSAGNPDEEPNLALYPVCPSHKSESLNSGMVDSTSKDHHAIYSVLTSMAKAASSSLSQQPLAMEHSPPMTSSGNGRLTGNVNGKYNYGNSKHSSGDDEDDGQEGEDSMSSEDNFASAVGGNTSAVVEARSWQVP